MTHTHEANEGREGMAVTQADREAALQHALDTGRVPTDLYDDAFRDGRWDATKEVQAFASHRHQSTASLEAERSRASADAVGREAIDAALDAEWLTKVGNVYSIREALEAFGPNLSTREIENAMHTALLAATSPPLGNEWAISYDREGPR